MGRQASRAYIRKISSPLLTFCIGIFEGKLDLACELGIKSL